MFRKTEKSVPHLLVHPSEIRLVRVLRIEGQSEVNDHGLPGMAVAKQDVLGLEVSVDHFVIVTMLDRIGQPQGHRHCLAVAQGPVLPNSRPECSAPDEFKYQEEFNALILPVLRIVIEKIG